MVYARFNTESLLVEAIISEAIQALSKFGRIGDDATSVADATQVLRRIETESGNFSKRPSFVAVDRCSLCLGAILNQWKPKCMADPCEFLDACRNTVKMHDDYRL